MNIKGLDFSMECYACPEEYYVFDGDTQVGYVRLRFGVLTCEYPRIGGEFIYREYIGDKYTGCFENNGQRDYHLKTIADKIWGKILE